MKKIIIAGAFDCIKQKEIHLIKEALKFSIPGELFVLLYGDYQHFKDFGYFPMQSFETRLNNLGWFVRPDHIILREDWLKGVNKACWIVENDKILFIHYADDKNFPGRNDLNECKIPIKFIKPYGK